LNTNPIQDPRRDAAWPLNGWANKPASKIDYAQRAARDIGDKNIDEEVVGFVRADKNTDPVRSKSREQAWPVNGWSNTPASKAFAQRNARDIGDKNIDEEVVGFVRADKNMDPVRSKSREQAWPANGWSNTPASQALNQHMNRDIAQPGVEPNVFDFTRDKVEALPWERRPEAFNKNGYAAGAWSLAQNSDIADKEVRPDVYVTVKSMVDPAPWDRSNKAPKDSYAPYAGVQEAYPKATKKEAEKESDLVQLNSQFLGSPERVNVLDPIAYQTQANGNTLDGGIQIRRTTFY